MKRIAARLEVAQEYAGFEEPRWLDGPPRKPAANGAVAGEFRRGRASAEQ